jgi:hypothetical protein
MPPKTLAATQFVPLSVERLRSLALQIPAVFIATVLAAVLATVLITRLEAVAYSADAVRPDAESILQVMTVSP